MNAKFTLWIATYFCCNSDILFSLVITPVIFITVSVPVSPYDLRRPAEPLGKKMEVAAVVFFFFFTVTETTHALNKAIPDLKKKK